MKGNNASPHSTFAIRRPLLIIVILFIVGFFSYAHAAQGQETHSLDLFAEYFYDRYSRHFDTFGLQYAAPDYSIAEWKKPETAREWMSLASYYAFRAGSGDERALSVIKGAIEQSVHEIESRPVMTLSFNDAEALFLVVRMIEVVPSLRSSVDVDHIQEVIHELIAAGVASPDTENRAIVGATHWYYLASYLHDRSVVNDDEFRSIERAIRNKIAVAVRSSITKSGWYREGKQRIFSVHYHIVSAYMLMMYQEMSNDRSYESVIRMMYRNIKALTFGNGMVEASWGNRPVGLGAQFYVMQGLLGQYVGDDDHRVYLFYANGNRFFSDPEHPDRLEYHSTIEFTTPQYHDDYAFSDVIELARFIPRFKTMTWQDAYALQQSIRASSDTLFTIKNTGQVITMNWKAKRLGSRGNWSRIVR